MPPLSPGAAENKKPQMLFGKIDDMLSRVSSAIDATRRPVFSMQHEAGSWCGQLEADTTLESDYILVHTLLGTENFDRQQRAAREILRHQKPDGGWPICRGGPSNISATVKAYFALKLTGRSVDDPVMVRARAKIL